LQMTKIPQGRRRSEDVDLLTTYLKAIEANQESLRLLVGAAANTFLSDQMQQDLKADAHYIDITIEELVRKHATLQCKAEVGQLEALGHLADAGNIVPIPINKTILGGEPCA